MYNVAIPPTFRHLPGHSSTSDHFSVIHYTGESEEPALEAGPMHEPVDPIFDNNHFSQGQHPVFEGTDPLYDPPTTYALYPVGHTPGLSSFFLIALRTRTSNMACSNSPTDLSIRTCLKK